MPSWISRLRSWTWAAVTVILRRSPLTSQSMWGWIRGVRRCGKPLDEALTACWFNRMVGKCHFPDGYFASAFSNSVLEHIPQVEAVLAETFRVLRPGAPFVFCGPNQRFLENLSIGNFLDGIHLR